MLLTCLKTNPECRKCDYHIFAVKNRAWLIFFALLWESFSLLLWWLFPIYRHQLLQVRSFLPQAKDKAAFFHAFLFSIYFVLFVLLLLDHRQICRTWRGSTTPPLPTKVSPGLWLVDTFLTSSLKTCYLICSHHVFMLHCVYIPQKKKKTHLLSQK